MEDQDQAVSVEKLTVVVHSGDFDKIYSAFIIGNGALSMGMEVSLYFTFWGLMRLKKGGLDSGPLSKMQMLGLGKWMIKRRMKKANVTSSSTNGTAKLVCLYTFDDLPDPIASGWTWGQRIVSSTACRSTSGAVFR